MYKLQNDWNGNFCAILRTTDNVSIPVNPDNTDYQAYLKWLEESPDNVPLPAENE